MTREEYNKLTFEEVAEILYNECDNITNINHLKDLAITSIKDNSFYLTTHIINAIENQPKAYYYDYDYCMGTLETPTPLLSKEDLLDYIDE